MFLPLFKLTFPNEALAGHIFPPPLLILGYICDYDYKGNSSTNIPDSYATVVYSAPRSRHVTLVDIQCYNVDKALPILNNYAMQRQREAFVGAQDSRG